MWRIEARTLSSQDNIFATKKGQDHRQQYIYHKRHWLSASDAIILNPAVGRGEVCGFYGAGKGETTRNGHSIPNAAMRRKNRAIRSATGSPKR